MANNLPTVPLGKVVNGEIIVADVWRSYFQSITSDVVRNNTNVGSILSGYAKKSELGTEVVARVAGDSAVSGSGDGTGVSNSGVYSGIAVTSASWVSAKALLVTPAGAPGSYTFTIFADIVFDTGVTISDTGTFNGLWRIVERRVSDSDETVIDSGTFTMTFSAGSVSSGEGGSVEIPDSVSGSFTGLPGVVAATYSTTQTELRLELSRASGSNTISGLSGSVAVTWSA